MFNSLTHSFRARFTITTVTIVMILTFVLSTFISSFSSEEIKSEIGTSLSQNAYQTSDKLENFMWARSGEVELLSKLSALKNPNNPKKIRELVEQLRASIPFYSWIGFMDPQGDVLASTDGILTGKNLSQRPVYQEALKGPFIGDVHEAVLLAKLLPQPTDGPLRFVDISVPVFNDEGKMTGILATHLSWEWAKSIEKSVLKPIKKNKQTEIFVVSKLDNRIILGSKDLIGETLLLPSVQNAQKGKNSWALEKWPDGKSYLTGYIQGKGYMDYKGVGWTVLVRQPLDVAYAPIAKVKNFILLLGFVCAAVFALAVSLLANQVSKPLRKLTEVANHLMQGNKVEIPQMKGFLEIEILSSSLRELFRSLTKTEKELTIMGNIAEHDPLTELPNRIALDRYIRDSVLQSNDEKFSLTILYLDLDDFKPVNDTYGHAAGDILLQEVAKKLKNNVRGKDFVARLGGDEFVIALQHPNEDPIQEYRMIAHRIIADIRETFIIEGNPVKIGCSIGGAVWPLHGHSIMGVMRLADASLYTAKRSGKNKVSFHGSNDYKVNIL